MGQRGRSHKKSIFDPSLAQASTLVPLKKELINISFARIPNNLSNPHPPPAEVLPKQQPDSLPPWSVHRV